MNRGFLTELKDKKEVHRRWEQGMATQEEYGDACKDLVRKAKAWLELKPARNVKGIKKGFYKYSISKRKAKENMCPLLTGAQNLIAKDIKKTKELSAFLASVFYRYGWPSGLSDP